MVLAGPHYMVLAGPHYAIGTIYTHQMRFIVGSVTYHRKGGTVTLSGTSSPARHPYLIQSLSR